MEKINNKNGITMFWTKANDVNKINILDSNGDYFNDLFFDVYEDDDGAEDIEAIINTLKNTTLEDMCNFFNANYYETLEELKQDIGIDEPNDYINTFIVNGKTYYTCTD